MTKSKMFVCHFILLVLLITPFYCDAKRTKIHHQKGKLLKVKQETIGKGFKKQGLEVPFDDREALGGEPVGNLNPEGGLDGLGGDMQGYPTGMGAGAEPLGAYDQREDQMQPSMQQGLDEGPRGFDGPRPIGFSREVPPSGFIQGSDSQRGDFFEGRTSQDMSGQQNFQRTPPDMVGPQDFQSEESGPFAPQQLSNQAAENVLGPQQEQGFLNPPPAMGESMSNSLEAMDKANIQGDREVGDMVRARNHQNGMGQPLDIPESEAAFMQQGQSPYGNELQPQEFRNFKTDIVGLEQATRQQDMPGNKRVLKKLKGKKKKWKRFKSLHQQGYKNLQGK